MGKINDELFNAIINNNIDEIQVLWENKMFQKNNKESFLEIMELVKDKPLILVIIWTDTIPELKKRAVENNPLIVNEIMEIVGNERLYKANDIIWMEEEGEVFNANLLAKLRAQVWSETDNELQKIAVDNNSQLVIDIINKVKDDPFYLSGVWCDTCEEVQKIVVENNPQLFINMVDFIKDNHALLFKALEATAPSILIENLNKNKKLNEQLFGIIVNLEKVNFKGVAKLWKYMAPNVKEERIEYLIKKHPVIWEYTDFKIQKTINNINPQLLDDIIKNSKNSRGIRGRRGIREIRGIKEINNSIWSHTAPEIQEEKLMHFIKEYPGIFKYTDPKVQEKKLIEIIDLVKDNPDSLTNVWSGTAPEVQEKKLIEIIELVKDNPNSLSMVWSGTAPEVQEKTLENNPKLLTEIIKSVKDKPYSLSEVWRGTNPEVREKTLENNPKLLTEIIKLVKDNPNILSLVWRGTNPEVQEKKLIEIIESVKDNPNSLSMVWRETDPKVQEKKLIEIIELVKDNPNSLSMVLRGTDPKVQEKKLLDTFNIVKKYTDENKNIERNTEGIKVLIENLSAKALYKLWDNLTTEEQKENLEIIIDRLCSDSISAEGLTEFLKKINEKIDVDKLSELLMMKDQSVLHKYMMNEILKKNMGNERIDIEKVNNEIDKIHNIFLTNNLPEVFKLYEFFKFHPNYMRTNLSLYNGISNDDRDKIMLQDLITAELESDNSQLLNFLELLYNGDIAYNKKRNGENLNEMEEAILASYSDTLVNLYQIFGTYKTEIDYYQNIENIRSKMNIQEGEKTGNTMLKQFLQEIGFETEKYSQDGENLIENLLEYMKKDKEKAIERNRKEINKNIILEAGDLIKGTGIQYLDEQLRLGIRSKEFYKKGDMQSDCTPFDTDFSEITSVNLQNSGIKNILNSTYSGAGFGVTYYVIKKGDYDESKSYIAGNDTPGNKTRYIRTAIGSNKISYIITSEWNEAYGYQMAQNGIFIPVIDLNAEEVLFTKEQYDSLREKMKGMSFYRAEDFEIDETVFNSKIQETAQSMKKQAQGKISTKEKREKIVEYVNQNMPKIVVENIVGDLSSDILEFIDTGSTGRGTNIPGDGDFDFMLKCSSKEEQSQMIAKLRECIKGTSKGGDNEFNIRYKDVDIPGLEEKIDLDVTSEKKSLDVEYSSDLCVRDRLDNIKENYGEETLGQVVNNIIVAKKILKQLETYKKSNSDGATKNGGFGGIGVENWILQNGGSFILAMETFLDAANETKEFSEFQNKYPIYDFGENHREMVSAISINPKHDRYILGLTQEGFDLLKEKFVEILREYGIEYEYSENTRKVNNEEGKKQEEVFEIFLDSITQTEKYKLSDRSRIQENIAKFHAHKQMQEKYQRA